VRRALQLSEQAHRGDNRKNGDHPYHLHVVAVTQLLGAAGADDDLLIAGYLHDAVEDTDVTLTEIGDEFGGRVADLVEGVTKPTHDPASGQELSKQQINAITVETMSQATQDIVVLKAADLIANISDLVLDQQQQGYGHWRVVFRSDEHAEFKIRHYLTLADVLLGRLAHPPAYPLLTDVLRERADQLRRLFDTWEH
jgi:(p)ppGpp synthase/HD superfamily hydrolase